MVHFRRPMSRVPLAFSPLPRRPDRPGPASPGLSWAARRAAWRAVLLVLLGLAVGLGGAASEEPAQAGGGDAAKLEARCAEEAGRLCPGLKPGRPFMVRCLQTHSSELSQNCVAYLKHLWQKAEVRFEELRGACSDELGQLCPQADERLGEAMRCLRRHDAQLSDGCKAELSRPRGPGAGSQPTSREGDGADPAVSGSDTK
jgi:hypothetical protein